MLKETYKENLKNDIIPLVQSIKITIMNTSGKNGGRNDKRKHSKLKKVSEILMPSSIFNSDGLKEGVILNQPATLGITLPFVDQCKQAALHAHDISAYTKPHQEITENFQRSVQSSGILEVAKNLQNATQGFNINDTIKQMNKITEKYNETMYTMKALVIPHLADSPLFALQNSSIFETVGLSATDGLLKYQGKSLEELEKEEQDTKFKEINNKLLDQQKIIEGTLLEERKHREHAEQEKRIAEDGRKEAEQKLAQSDGKIAKMEAELTIVKKSTDVINKWLKSGKSNQRQKGKFPKIKCVYRSLVMYENGKFAVSGIPFPLEPKLRKILALLIEKQGKTVTYDDILEECYEPHERYNVKQSKTIAKYISKLQKPLKVHFQEKIICNDREIGWYLKSE